MTSALQILIFGYIGTITVILLAVFAIEYKREIRDKEMADELERNLARFREMQRDFREIDDLKFLLDTGFSISLFAKRFFLGIQLRDALRIVRETTSRLEGRREA